MEFNSFPLKKEKGQSGQFGCDNLGVDASEINTAVIVLHTRPEKKKDNVSPFSCVQFIWAGFRTFEWILKP